jgi:hypothetical protein
MKKLLAIMVLGILLASCSEYNKKKLLENCADGSFEEEQGVQPILKLDLKGKLFNKVYYFYYGLCEEKEKTHGTRFKEKWK